MTGRDFTASIISFSLSDAPRVAASFAVSSVAFEVLSVDVPEKRPSRPRSINGAGWGFVRCEMTVELFLAN